jgi:hypothetical protein
LLSAPAIGAKFRRIRFPCNSCFVICNSVRCLPLTFTNLSIQRTFGAGGGRTWQVRFDAQNVFNRQQWLGPMLNPTSTQFGEVTTVALNQMGFFWFGVRGTFQVRRSLGEGGTPLLVRSRGPRGPAPLTRRTRSRSCAEHLEFTSFGRERRCGEYLLQSASWQRSAHGPEGRRVWRTACPRR